MKRVLAATALAIFRPCAGDGLRANTTTTRRRALRPQLGLASPGRGRSAPTVARRAPKAANKMSKGETPRARPEARGGDQ
jgi:hypothetical protein